MKRIGFIYEEIVSVENCKRAIIKASKHKTSRSCVKRIMSDIDFYAEDLSKRLKNDSFISPYERRVINDSSSGKEREILIPCFYPDQCAHHAIMLVVMPIIKKSSYYWSCANMPNRGIKHAAKGVTRITIRNPNMAKYCIKLDVKKFYPSVPHDGLKNALRRKFKDEKVLHLFDILIDSCEEGLPIGNYTSPWFAEFYLQFVDRKILNSSGTKGYVRYADDMVIFGNNKKELRKVLCVVSNELSSIGLRMKENYQLFKVKGDKRVCKTKKQLNGRKVDFVGRCFAKGYTTVRKRCALKIMKQSRRIQKWQREGAPISFTSASGFLSRASMLSYTNSQNLKHKYIDVVNLKDLKNIVRKHSYKEEVPA